MDMGLNQQQKREQSQEQQKATQEQGPKKSAGLKK
jgi:hypothetical protein